MAHSMPRRLRANCPRAVQFACRLSLSGFYRTYGLLSPD